MTWYTRPSQTNGLGVKHASKGKPSSYIFWGHTVLSASVFHTLFVSVGFRQLVMTTPPPFLVSKKTQALPWCTRSLLGSGIVTYSLCMGASIVATLWHWSGAPNIHNLRDFHVWRKVCLLRHLFNKRLSNDQNNLFSKIAFDGGMLSRYIWTTFTLA